MFGWEGVRVLERILETYCFKVLVIGKSTRKFSIESFASQTSPSFALFLVTTLLIY
jgi:hypothetical protein